jgi:CDP-paratose 2-epimerase
MKLLITGVCGFVGSALAASLLERIEGLSIVGIDNLMRPGSETNVERLRRLGVAFVHGDIRSASDVEALPDADWVIDAAANPSVLAGVGGGGTSRQLVEHNLGGLLEILEYAKRHSAGVTILSSSRVYSIAALAALPLRDTGRRFELDGAAALPPGVSARGVTAEFSTAAPISLYGSTKLAGEVLALEYGDAFGFPVWINRCGVMAGAGQFGTAGQGIFAFWVNAHLRRRALRYIGFDGRGKQVRDALHPADLAALIDAQMRSAQHSGGRIYTAGGGPENSMSLCELNDWCDERFGAHRPAPDVRPRTYDVPWLVMDSSAASRDFGWRPAVTLQRTLEEIAAHAAAHPDWLERSGA